MIQVAVMGHGVVGSGVAEILIDHPDRIQKAVKTPVNLKYILDIREFDSLPYREKFTKDFSVILNDPEVRVVAETMGGIEPAYTFVKQCLLAGKSVVTSNKALVAAKGAELIRIANEKNVNFLFEASVGGGIPILRPLTQCLSANEITEIAGILNGTTNFILNKMIMDNMGFDAALRLAQEKGYAEKNPAADIEGHDTCRKICILATLAFGKHVYPEQVKTEGITDITLDDVETADRLGCAVKLIGRTKKLPGGRITATVRPTLVGRNRLLSGVDGVFNAVSVIGDETGEVIIYGQGAGKEATASAVVADMIDCIKHLDTRKYLDWEDGFDGYVDNTADEEKRLFVSLCGEDLPSLVSQAEAAFPGVKMLKNESRGEVAFLTDPEAESVTKEKLSKFSGVKSAKILDTML